MLPLIASHNAKLSRTRNARSDAAPGMSEHVENRRTCKTQSRKPRLLALPYTTWHALRYHVDPMQRSISFQ